MFKKEDSVWFEAERRQPSALINTQAPRNIQLTAFKWLFKHRIKGSAAVPDHFPTGKVII